MGRTRAVTYAVHLDTGPGHYNTPSEWRVKARFGVRGYGAPTDANLARYVADLEESAQPGGTNTHLSTPSNPFWVHSAKIVHQSSGRVVAAYRGASFRVF